MRYQTLAETVYGVHALRRKYRGQDAFAFLHGFDANAHVTIISNNRVIFDLGSFYFYLKVDGEEQISLEAFQKGVGCVDELTIRSQPLEGVRYALDRLFVGLSELKQHG